MANIVRFKNFNKESDVFVYLIELLEKDFSMAKKIFRTAWDLIGVGKRNTANSAIKNMAKSFVKKKAEDIKNYVLEEIDATMMVDDPKFLDTCGNILAKGIVGDMEEMPMRYKKFLSTSQQEEVENFINSRGQSKFEVMMDNKTSSKVASELAKIAKELQAGNLGNYISKLERNATTNVLKAKKEFDSMKNMLDNLYDDDDITQERMNKVSLALEVYYDVNHRIEELVSSAKYIAKMLKDLDE